MRFQFLNHIHTPQGLGLESEQLSRLDMRPGVQLSLNFYKVWSGM